MTPQPGPHLQDTSLLSTSSSASSASVSDSAQSAPSRQRSINGEKVRKTVEYFESSETPAASEDDRPSSPHSAERRPSVSQKLRDKMKELAMAMEQDVPLSPLQETAEPGKEADDPAPSHPPAISIITNPAALPPAGSAASPASTRMVVTTPEFDRYLEKRRLEASLHAQSPTDSTVSPTDLSPSEAVAPSSASSVADSGAGIPVHQARQPQDAQAPPADHALAPLTEEETDFSDLPSPRLSGAFHATTGTQKSQGSSSAVHIARVGKLLPVLRVFQRPAKQTRSPRSLKDRHSIASSGDETGRRSWSASSAESGESQARKRTFLPWSRGNKRKKANRKDKRHSEAEPAIAAMEQSGSRGQAAATGDGATVHSDASTSRLAVPANAPSELLENGSNDESWITDKTESSGEADHTGLGEELSRNIPVDAPPARQSASQPRPPRTEQNTAAAGRARRQSSRDSISCGSCLEYTASIGRQGRRQRSRASSLSDLPHGDVDGHVREHDPRQRFSTSDTAETRSLDRALSLNERHRRSIRWRSDDHYSIAWRDATAMRGSHARHDGARRDRGSVEQYWADRTFDEHDSRYPSTRRTQQSRRRGDIHSYGGNDPAAPLPSRCELCFEYAREYRVLPCQHTYCRDCLRRIVDDDDLRRRSWSSLPHPHQTLPPPPPTYLNNLMMPAPPGAMMMPNRPLFAPGMPMPGFFPQPMPTPGYPMGAAAPFRPPARLGGGYAQDADVTPQRMEEGEVAGSDIEDEEEGDNEAAKARNKQEKESRSRSEINRPIVRLPNWKRLYLRLAQLVAATGAFGFLVGAKPYSGTTGPQFEDRTAVYFLYVMAVASFLLAVAHAVYFYLRLKRARPKFNQWYICGVDFFMFLFWGAEVGVLLSKNSCPSGTFNGWCTFFNVAIFWGFASFVSCGVATVWDVAGIWIASRRRSQQRQQQGEVQTRTTVDTHG
ncbi:hypothetical protein SYNPS1DRAFT_30355 [Syncephalis pseudoplumigaleata]|uniref:Zinc finger C3HC4 RING-type domain-containing protein n=1 Tax=Syncephalis pseudoplumigaleata TaxID=1712513 RepID=A0A4P9YV13_9FUNG|nr:hypothetical protein SYNPS1DRAFT_30355 [Syncephalis pseudoplumigaleata]|eukprot:RKP23883.1 hypothetical protein SYNPS1DRAFT_30355 [Syncephalis pseudoplumigaleata]